MLQNTLFLMLAWLHQHVRQEAKYIMVI